MKTIEVSDEMYEFLMNLSKEINSQDHRCTRMPYFFQVETQKKVYNTSDGEHRVMLFDCDNYPCDTEEEAKELIESHCEGWGKDLPNLDDMDMFECVHWLEMAGFEEFYYDYEPEYKNAFFTAKACREHIERNKHHYNNGVDYLTGSFRNPELEMVYKFLCELSGGEIHY